MPEKITIEQLHGHPTYIWLTLKQRALIDAYWFNGGDKLKAVQAAYRCKSVESARVLSFSLFANPKIISCLAVANGEDPERKKFDLAQEKAIANPKTSPAKIAALRLLALTRGWILPSLKPEPAPDPRIPADKPKGVRIREGFYDF